MRGRLGILALALGLSGVAVHPGAAQPPQGGPAAAGYTQLFVSPCGEPYRGKPGDPYPVALWFKMADLNHDGVIDLKEFKADHAGFFEALDSDDNGVLEGPELSFYERQVLPDVFVAERFSQLTRPRLGLALASDNDASDHGGAKLILVQQWLPNLMKPAEGSHPGEAHGYNPDTKGAKGPTDSLGSSRPEQREMLAAARFGLLAEAEPIRAADANLDGRITKAEFLAAAERRFKALDKRKDGKLTLDELPATPAQLELARQDRKRK